MHQKTKKILQLLRLKQFHFQDTLIQCDLSIIFHIPHIFNEVFLKVNKATINMLRRVEPYVTYPNLKSEGLGKHEDMRNHYVEGGDAGNHEDYINELIRRMN
ncbi:hypothetical protein IEQ34_022760 [Dendrobium chrysotoxum]|uniref:Uncharacterized protein n=1 Tax=Dendrobium chrysotoxum TaxID=161865 RepID=A0AAV7FYD6_DENCH|nr:hypothetical protein IEQ34_022760 [Dendrobium chrysotoxum]